MSSREAAEARLAEAIESRSDPCVVVGLGFIGTTLMHALRAAEFEARGYDRDPQALGRFRGATPGALGSRPWSAGDDPAVLTGARLVVVAVRAPVAAVGVVDLEPLQNVAQMLKAHPADERLVLLESTVPPGATRRFATWCEGAATDLFVAHGPERLSVGHDHRTLRRTAHLTGGVDAASTRLAHCLLGCICDEAVAVSSPEVSELSKLLENAFLTVGIALAGEITRIAHALGLPARQVTEAAATKPFGYFPFHPGPGVGGHCLPNDLRILGQAAAELGCESELVSATKRIIDASPGIAVDRLEELLRERGRPVEQARVLLVGMGFKVGSADTTESPAFAVARVLRSRGASVTCLDTRNDSLSVDGEPLAQVAPEELRGERFDAAMVLAGDPELEASELEASTDLVLDTGGGTVLRGKLADAHEL